MTIQDIRNSIKKNIFMYIKYTLKDKVLKQKTK